MSSRPDPPRRVIRTAVAGDLPQLQRLYQAAALSNAGDAPLLVARPEFLVFVGGGIAEKRTRCATSSSRDGDGLDGFATVAVDVHGGLELEDLFVDPTQRRQGIARQLVLDAAETGRQASYRWLSVTGNPHALAFYRAVGFVEVGRVSTQLGYGIRMRLDLTRP